MLVSNIDWDDYVGRVAIGRITSGTVKKGDTVWLHQSEDVYKRQFPMSVYSDVNNYQDSDYVINNFSIKEQEYLKKYILQSSAFLMRAVGCLLYTSH